MNDLMPVMNDTKWEELRLAMYHLDPRPPRWRTKDVSTGDVSRWDAEWFYHFRAGGYRTIEWVEIEVPNPEHEAAILARLREIHLPGMRTGTGFRIYGYVPAGMPINYIE